MTLFITKNGQKLGPYSFDEAQALVANGTLLSSDWAWYEGLPNWVPLDQVPGFATAGPRPSGGRPPLVWGISLFYFICTPFSLLSLLLIPVMLSGSFPLPKAQRAYFESLTYFDYIAPVITTIVNLTAATQLFRLKRSALYFFAASFVLGVLMIAYNIFARNWLQAMGIAGVIGGVFGLDITVAIILYVWHLFRKGVLH
jgi:hypothetical protein